MRVNGMEREPHAFQLYSYDGCVGLNSKMDIALGNGNRDHHNG